MVGSKAATEGQYTRQDARQDRPRWVLSLLLALTFICHLPALWGGFVYDDIDDVITNPSARAESFAGRLWSMNRPLLKASYALQDALHGPFAPAYHLVNLALHLWSVALVMALVRRAAGLAGHDAARSVWIGALAAALWAVHPAAVDTVGQVAGRSAGLSTALVLTALWLATGGQARPLAAGLAAGLAVLSRETALIAPVLLVVWQICLPGKDAARRALPVWIGAMLAVLVLAALPRHRELLAFSLDSRGPLDALRANLFAVTEMLRLWTQPWQIGALPVQPIVYGWTDLPTLLRLGGLAGVAFAALVMRRRWPLLALAVLWAAVALLPTNSVIWRVNPVAMRPLYLAGIGLALVLALALSRHLAGRALAGLLVLALGSLTWHRATLLSDPVAYFTDAARHAADEAAPLVLLGLSLANAGRTEEAIAALSEALRIDPSNTEASNTLRLLKAASVYSPTAP